MTEATHEAGEPPAEVAYVVALLRERRYGAISCLATLAVLARYSDEDTSAWARILDVLVATGGLWAAAGGRGRRTRGCGAARRQRQDHCALT